MDKSEEKKDGSMRFPTLAPETMVLGSEHPRESLEEEGGGAKSRISLMSICGRDGEEPSKPIPETSVYGPVDDGAEESWHDAREEGCDVACEVVDEETRERPD